MANVRASSSTEMAFSSVEINTEKLDDALRQLAGQISDEKLTEVMEAGAEVIRKAAEDNAKKISPGKFGRGVLRDEIVKQTERESSRKVTVRIGPTRDAFWGAIMEVGFKRFRIEDTNRHVSSAGFDRVPPNPWLRPAFDENKFRATNVAADMMIGNLEAVAEG